MLQSALGWTKVKLPLPFVAPNQLVNINSFSTVSLL